LTIGPPKTYLAAQSFIKRAARWISGPSGIFNNSEFLEEYCTSYAVHKKEIQQDFPALHKSKTNFLYTTRFRGERYRYGINAQFG
jgi:hypothetical protein